MGGKKRRRDREKEDVSKERKEGGIKEWDENGKERQDEGRRMG